MARATLSALGGATATFVCLVGTTGIATASEAVSALKQNLDMSWTLTAAGLVLMMQLGFLLLEAGMVRSKNSINVAQKNLLDLVFAVMAFAAVGFMLAFAPSVGPFGLDLDFFMLSSLDPWQTAFFVFQVMFCGTAATIVSGAVAERMRLASYVAGSVFIACVIYPVFVHWAWGNALFPNEGAFLARMGFVDFAGSTVVHATGAWMALAACLVLGAREGRFDDDGNPVRIPGHSPVLAASGAMVLFVGWIGFNGGSTLSASPAISGIIANTVLAAAAGGTTGYVAGWWVDRIAYPEKAVSGLLGGLVAVTAGCMVLTPGGALAIGALGGFVAVWGNNLIERRWKVDDAVGAIGVHGFAGVVGTLGIALLAPVANLPAGTRLDQFLVQATGVSVNFVWAFGGGMLFFWALGRLVRMRVTADEEKIGLNEAEHATRMGVGHVERALETLVAGNADLGMRLRPIAGDESETLTHLFNALMSNIQAEEQAREQAAVLTREAEEAERMSALANATFEAIWILQDGRIVDGNHKLEELFGIPLLRLRGRPAVDLVARASRNDVQAAMLQPVVGPYEAEIVDGAGERIPVEMRGREIVYRGRIARVGCLVDLRERKSAEARMRHLAQHDPLTGLPNRALFNERLGAVLSRSPDVYGKRALLLVDLDKFKDINDVYGHPAGDHVIRTAAARLDELAGSDGSVARLGGDEFAVILTGLAFAAQAADFAFRIVNSLIQPIRLADGTQVRVGASIGVAVSPEDANDSEKLISRADIALYHAKSMGRNTYCLFEAGMDAALEKRRLLEADLSMALERNEFELHFQPRVSVEGARIVSHEALLRWRHPERGLISPVDFIPIAEQTGKIIAIGEWVFRTACGLARSELGDARVSINVSPVQFRQRNFVDMVEAAIRETGIDPERVEIEVTEGVLIDDDKRADRILRQLKDLGVTLALDDFGTGYSSLSYLSRFPFDTIKIDRSFVSELAVSETSQAIVRSITSLGSGLNMKVVAEGVEGMAEARMLVASGCQELQGYLLGRPVPVHLVRASDNAFIAGIVSEASSPAPDGTALRAMHAELRRAG